MNLKFKYGDRLYAILSRIKEHWKDLYPKWGYYENIKHDILISKITQKSLVNSYPRPNENDNLKPKISHDNTLFIHHLIRIHL